MITGFGRLGYAFAAERYGVTPDLIAFAKGVTSGGVPMGGVIAREGVYDAFMQGPEQAIELFHGYTYSAHPLACAADSPRSTSTATKGCSSARASSSRCSPMPRWRSRAARRARHPHSGLDRRHRSRAASRRAGRARPEAMNRAFHDEGLMIRITGDTIALCPPLIVREAQIGEMFDKVARVIRAMA